ncbi:hypothetical protein [Leptospira andrefontaineae]|uniref:DUF3108 domain-containing protein n=1 Tax=Leptospira andrefontaineae TaxID=2484976 RepID=A0A4R9H3U4_9LEPT|nr:hypothetical protein [Leptospira andrefontaineae]TGK39550.1 hypothetical protein EHO65_10055 [Leptospira andrefontaineae]
MYNSIFVLIFLFLVFPLASNDIGKIRFSGTATDLETGNLLYKDFHEETWENGKHVSSIIIYKDPEGKVFAKKKINFLKNRILPEFQLEDYRDGYLEGGVLQGATSVKLFARKKLEDIIQEKTVETGNLSALDGGFDYFVIDHWEELLSGKKINFHFLVPSERDKFLFSVEKTKEGDYKGKPALFLKLKIASAILSMFVKPIDLVYDIESKRIMEYRGTSNINDENGKSYKVKIVYGLR